MTFSTWNRRQFCSIRAVPAAVFSIAYTTEVGNNRAVNRNRAEYLLPTSQIICPARRASSPRTKGGLALSHGPGIAETEKQLVGKPSWGRPLNQALSNAESNWRSKTTTFAVQSLRQYRFNRPRLNALRLATQILTTQNW